MKKIWKKLFCVVLTLVLVAGCCAALAACNNKVIMIWGPGDHEEIYLKYLNKFAEEHKDELGGYTFQYAGSGDAGAYSAMSTDSSSVGVYTFANDQMANLINLNALAVISGDNLKWSEENNIKAAFDATQFSDGKYYAYPLQADNGYFLYYNKAAFKGSAIAEADGTLKDNFTFRDLYNALEATSNTSEYKNASGETVTASWNKGIVTWPMGDSWYTSGVFFAVGADYYVEYDSNGKQTDNTEAWFGWTNEADPTNKDVDLYDYKIGMNAYQCLKNSITKEDGKTVNPHYLYSDGSAFPLNDYITYYTDVNDAQHWGQTPLAAVVCGTWKAQELQKAWGDDYAATWLPILENDAGQQFSMKNFAGYKHMGVNPQCDFVINAGDEAYARLSLLHELAQYLCGVDISVERYMATGAGPANKEALENETIANDAALLALNKQYDRVCVYPEGYTGIEIAYTVNEEGKTVRTVKQVKAGDPVGNGLGFRTQDSVPSGYWTPIQNFGNTLYQEFKPGGTKKQFANTTSIQAALRQLQKDIETAAE